MHSLQILVRRWAAESVMPLPPVDAHSVIETFTRLHSVATPDVIHLYCLMGGMENMTNDLWRHWSMTEILEENRDPSNFGVLFADFLVSSWCYRLLPNANDTSAVYVDHFDGKDPYLVASSLEEFFDSYLRNPKSFLDSHAGSKSDA
jgi:hypothetical protein